MKRIARMKRESGAEGVAGEGTEAEGKGQWKAADETD